MIPCSLTLSSTNPLSAIMTNPITDKCIFLFLTEYCNLSCRHCYVWAEPAPKPSLPLNVLDSVLALCDQLSIRDIRLTGGEPTSHPAFQTVLSRLFERDFKIRLITNE